MSPRRWTEGVQDIPEAMAEIQAFTQDMDFGTFEIVAKAIRAVILDFIIIGEAVYYIPDDVRAAHPEVPWHFMRAMRNRLAHVYFSVDPNIVQDTIQNDLPPLVEPLKRLLDAGDEITDHQC